MVESIPPAGMEISQYPPIVRTPETTRMIDLSKLIFDLEGSVRECKEQFDRLSVPESMFFLSRFGPDPFTKIIQTHFTSPEGKPLELNTTQLRQLGQEMAAYKDPGPLTYKGDKFIIMLTYANKYVKNRVALEAKKKELFDLGTTSLIGMKAPPIPAQISVMIDSGQFNSLKVGSNSPKTWGSISTKKAIFADLTNFFQLKPSNPLVNKLKKDFNFTFDQRLQDYIHPSGYALSPFLIYHSKSIVDNPTSVGYWGHVAKYRLHASRIAEKVTEVRLIEVNPITGAPFNNGVVAGVYSDEPSNALAAVRKMYPFVLELQPNINPKLNKSITIDETSSKLKSSAERWGLTGNKGDRHFVNIIRTTWDWPDIDLATNQKWYDAFNSSKKANNGKRTFMQQQLLDFQSEDLDKRKAAIIAGNPPSSIKHLLFGGSPAQMRNAFPISVSEFYLLPAGTEQALERLCLVTKSNALIRLVNTRLKGTEVSNKRFKLESNMTQDNFNKELKLINSDMQLLKAAVSSPYLHTLGYEKLLAGNSLENLGMSSTLACRMRVKKMFEAAKWPRAAGELVFKAPINDQTDSQVMRGKFIDAMKQTGKTAPAELSYFEMPNMRVEYTYGVSNVVKPNFQINYGNGYPFTDAKKFGMSGDYKTVDTQLFRYYDVGKTNASWKTLYISRELKFAKGVYTRSRDGSQSSGTFSTLTTVVDEQPTNQLSSMIGDYNFTQDALAAGATAATLGVLTLGYLHFKRRAWND
jgi:hypothetical protein